MHIFSFRYNPDMTNVLRDLNVTPELRPFYTSCLFHTILSPDLSVVLALECSADRRLFEKCCPRVSGCHRNRNVAET